MLIPKSLIPQILIKLLISTLFVFSQVGFSKSPLHSVTPSYSLTPIVFTISMDDLRGMKQAVGSRPLEVADFVDYFSDLTKAAPDGSYVALVVEAPETFQDVAGFDPQELYRLQVSAAEFIGVEAMVAIDGQNNIVARVTSGLVPDDAVPAGIPDATLTEIVEQHPSGKRVIFVGSRSYRVSDALDAKYSFEGLPAQAAKNAPLASLRFAITMTMTIFSLSINSGADFHDIIAGHVDHLAEFAIQGFVSGSLSAYFLIRNETQALLLNTMSTLTSRSYRAKTNPWMKNLMLFYFEVGFLGASNVTMASLGISDKLASPLDVAIYTLATAAWTTLTIEQLYISTFGQRDELMATIENSHLVKRKKIVERIRFEANALTVMYPALANLMVITIAMGNEGWGALMGALLWSTAVVQKAATKAFRELPEAERVDLAKKGITMTTWHYIRNSLKDDLREGISPAGLSAKFDKLKNTTKTAAAYARLAVQMTIDSSLVQVERVATAINSKIPATNMLLPVPRLIPSTATIPSHLTNMRKTGLAGVFVGFLSLCEASVLDPDTIVALQRDPSSPSSVDSGL